jgi:predicted nucleic acid-binding protein
VGSLTLPSTGLVYVDTQIVIYSVETHPAYWSTLRPLWTAVQHAPLSIVSSQLTMLETMVAPLRAGDLVLCKAYEQLFEGGGVRLLPISELVLKEAAKLRAASPSLRTPDAIHAATALIYGCAMFLTNDESFRSVTGLPLVMLNDVLAS